MALQCPQCANSIEADFGVVTCPRCQSVLFIDMEGQIQLSDAPPALANPEFHTADPVEEISSHSPTPAEFQDSWMQDQNPDLGGENEGPAGFEMQLEAPAAELESNETFTQDSHQDEQLPDSIEVMEPQPSDETVFPGSVPVRDPGDLSDVAEFSNADQAFGPLSYSVTIEEIDTKETRQLLADALSDPKFQWDSRELLKKVKMGKLQLDHLSPVKASVLVHRLQTVPVKVSWTQNVFS